MLHVGMRVVCIDDAWTPGTEINPVKDVVYTIRDIVDDNGALGLRFEEIVNQPSQYVMQNGQKVFDECCFVAESFKPVIDLGWAHRIVAEVMDKNKQPVRAS